MNESNDPSDDLFGIQFNHLSDLLPEVIKNINTVKDNITLYDMTTGFISLDRITGGFRRGEFIIVGGRPGMGKSSFILSLIRNLVVDFKYPVGIFSLKSSAREQMIRLISMQHQISATKLKTGNLTDAEMTHINESAGKMIGANLVIDDSPELDEKSFRKKSEQMVKEEGVKMIFLDYIQLMNSGTFSGNRDRELGMICRSLYITARELDVPVIVTSQLSRSVENREGLKKPLLSDLSESGAPEHIADKVIFIYRPEYYCLYHDEDGNSMKGIAEIILAKNKNGPISSFYLRFQHNTGRFHNLDDGEIPFKEIKPEDMGLGDESLF